MYKKFRDNYCFRLGISDFFYHVPYFFQNWYQAFLVISSWDGMSNLSSWLDIRVWSWIRKPFCDWRSITLPSSTRIISFFISSSFKISGGALVGAGLVKFWCICGASRCAIRTAVINSFLVFCPAANSILSWSHLSRRIVSDIFWCLSGAVMVWFWCVVVHWWCMFGLSDNKGIGKKDYPALLSCRRRVGWWKKSPCGSTTAPGRKV